MFDLHYHFVLGFATLSTSAFRVFFLFIISKYYAAREYFNIRHRRKQLFVVVSVMGQLNYVFTRVAAICYTCTIIDLIYTINNALEQSQANLITLTVDVVLTSI